MPSLIEAVILCGLLAFMTIAIWLIVQGVRVVRQGGKDAQRGTVKIKVFGSNSIEITGAGGIILVAFGVLLLAFTIVALLWMRQNQAVRAQLAKSEARYASLNEAYRTLKQEHEELLAVQKPGPQSSPETAKLAWKIDAILGKRLEQTNRQIADLQARMDAISNAQSANGASQAEMAKEVTELSRTIAAQSRDFEAVRAKLRTFELQSEVADVIAEASPAQFSPTSGWEFVEEPATKGQQRKFILAMHSPLVAKSKGAFLTWQITDADKQTVVFKGSVADSGIIQRMDGLCTQRGITCLMGDVSVSPQAFK